MVYIPTLQYHTVLLTVNARRSFSEKSIYIKICVRCYYVLIKNTVQEKTSIIKKPTIWFSNTF